MPKSKRVFLFKLFLVLLAVVLFIVPDTIMSPEIEERVMATVLGLDKKEDMYTVTAQVVVPKRASQGEPTQEVVKAEGVSVAEGIEKLNRTLGRRIELGHCGVIALGDLPSLDDLEYFVAGGIVTSGTQLVQVENAAEFIESVKDMSSSAATGLDGFILYATNSNGSATRNLLGFVSDTASASRTGYMPVLEAEKEGDSGSGGSGGSGESGGSSEANVPAAAEEGGSGGSGGQKKTPVIKSVEQTAIFVDYKRVGTFDDKETRGLAWIDRGAKRGFVELEKLEHDGVNYGGMYAQLQYKSASLKPYFKDGKPFVCIKVRCKLKLEDMHKLNLLARELGEKEAGELVQESFAKLIQSEIGAGMLKAASMDADPFGIRTAFYRFANKQYQAYDREAFMDDVRVEYDVRVKIL